jgi:hypothetical protein
MAERELRKRWWQRGATRDAGPGPAQPLPDEAAPPAGTSLNGSQQWIVDYTRIRVRSGVYDSAHLRDAVTEAVKSRISDADLAAALATQYVDRELAQWRADAEQWLGRTDPERLDAALERVRAEGVLVVAGSPYAADVARPRLPGEADCGVVGYHIGGIAGALRDGTLELIVIRADGEPAPREDALMQLVQDALAGEGLLASTEGHDGVVVVPMAWRRRPPRSLAPDADEPADPLRTGADDGEPLPTDSHPEDRQ